MCRATDVLCRIGGDEFAVLAPATTGEQAVVLANRLRKALEAHSSSAMPLSVSIGVSDLAQIEGDRPEALVEAADVALYAAKHGGRNQVIVNKAAPVSRPSLETLRSRRSFKA